MEMRRNRLKRLFLFFVLFLLAGVVIGEDKTANNHKKNTPQTEYTETVVPDVKNNELNTSQTESGVQNPASNNSETDTNNHTSETSNEEALHTDADITDSTVSEENGETELPVNTDEAVPSTESQGLPQNDNSTDTQQKKTGVTPDAADEANRNDGSQSIDKTVDSESVMPEEPVKEPLHITTHVFDGGVTAIAESPYNRAVFVAGNDGFVSAYSYRRLQASSFQISCLPVKLLSAHPQKNYIAVYETDGFSVHRISVWDWTAKKKLFSKNFSSSVVSLSWSAKGSYLFAGTASMEGITVFDIRGRQKKIYKTPPGIVLLAATGVSEKKIVTYGESGRLVYADIARRSILKQYETEDHLKMPELIKKYTRIIGYKDGKVVVVKAASGEVLKTYPARSALFAGSLKDSVPVWIEKGKKARTWFLCKGEKKSPEFIIPTGAKITAARHSAGGIILGTGDGKVYRLKQKKNEEIFLSDLTVRTAEKITDICIANSKLYMLTHDALYSASLKSKRTEVYLQNTGAEKCTPYRKGFLLWSKNKRAPLYYAEKDTKVQVLYYPKESCNSISIYRDTIAVVHPFSGLVLINGKTGKKLFTYKAAGLQEAVQIDDTFVLISKSAADTSGRPLFLINIKTEETIPLNLEGALVFSLKAHRGKKQTFSCMRVIVDPNPKTQLVAMSINLKQPKKSKFRTVVSYKAEDLNAFIHEEKDTIITNMGNGGLVIYNKRSRRQQRCKRDYALPYNAVSSKYYVITLNYDGSISWYRKKTGELLMTTQLQMTE